MKQLTRIRLINWHLFENTTITCHGTTYFIGVNGVGKSTILDAIQFALVGGQRDVKYNQAAMSGSRRTLAGYVRGELGTEGQRFLRGDATAVVALEFRNPDGSAFVHGAVADAYEDGRAPNIVYFIVNGAELDDAWFFRGEGQVLDSRAFHRHLENFALPSAAHARVFTRLEDYRFHLLNRLGQLKETFPAKITKGVAFSPLTNIRDFVRDYLLDEDLVDVKTLRDQLETMRHFEGLAADVRQRIAELTRIEELDQERQANRRRRITNGVIRRRALADTHLARLKRHRLELDQAQLDLSRLGLQRDDLAERLAHARQALVDAQVALRTDTTAIRQESLREEIARAEVELADLRQREAQARETLAREVKDAKRLRDLLVEDSLEIPPCLQTFIEEHETRTTQPFDYAQGRHATHDLQSDLETLGRHYAEQHAMLKNQSDQLRQEAEQIEREIIQLRTGDQDASTEAAAPAAARLRRLLRAELGLEADEVTYLCTVLRIPDESWQDAVEGILGHSRFDLLVPPEHYDAAMRLYRQRRLKDDLHGVGLPDAERILREAPPQSPPQAGGNLASEVETDHPAARALVDMLLGGTVKCDTLEEMRDHRTAVTRDCFARRNYTSRHLDPHTYRRWFIGERAVPRQIEQREERLDGIRSELVTLQARDAALRERLALTQDKVRVLIELERDLPGLDAIPTLVAGLDSLRGELASLDTQTVETLQAEVERRQAEADALQSEADQIERDAGRLESRIETLSGETVPTLEREAAQVVQDIEQFLLKESAETLREEIGKEYERRRERQPLETVLDNATRYEGDYQTAEERSHTSLREAKHGYSLTYQFGTDADEDAARYLAERDRYVESELPEYEARIAEQRALAEQELVENFVHRLREQIEDARQQLAYLNTTLAGLRFGGERFEFIARPEPTLRQVYDMIMDSQNILGESLFESDFRQRHQQGWDLLFERLTAGPGEELAPELRELQDYRNYLCYDIRIHYPNGDRALLSQIKAKKSGGETTTPFYVAMAASFAQAYRLNQPRPSDTIRLALFDEAFGKMDTARTASALQFMVDSKLQVLLATPPDKAAGLLPHVDSVRTVVRKDNRAFVIEIDKARMMQELEAVA
ncbi:MAG: AAA family ATPase [Anaerolineae bacterium]|nr:AAA family ATPase [Anaerolineae bacterium]